MSETWGFAWRSRDGRTFSRLSNIEGPRLRAEIVAREFGWPGHGGNRLDYLKDDLRAFRQRIRAIFSPIRTKGQDDA